MLHGSAPRAVAELRLVSSVKRLLLSVAFLTGICFATAQTTDSPAVPISHRKAKAVAISAPRPDYPLEARARHFTGSGIAFLEIDRKTGYVTAARMLKSTGHVILDNAALSAFMRWRFKPGTVHQVRIPINYTIHQPKS
jgi:TonB family protein